MWVRSIQIESFKTLRQEHLTLRSGVNIFIGKNNSGKSNLLESVIFFSPRAAHTDRLSPKDQSASLALQLQLSRSDAQELGISGTQLSLSHRGSGMHEYRTERETVDVARVTELIGHHVRHINTSLIFMEPDMGWKTSGLIRRTDLMNDVRVMRTKYPRAAAAFNDAMADCFPYVDAPQSSAITDHPRRARIQEGEHAIQPQRMGMGYRQVFVMLFYLLFPETHVLMIDEPENHLHPHLQRKLLNYFERESSRVQVLLSTHSPIFVAPRTIPNLFRVVRDENGSHVHPKHVAHEQMNLERLVQEVNPESSEVLFADHVVLVEGEADEIFLKRLIERFYTGHRDITVMAVHSNTNFHPMQQVLELLEIPYTIMTDRDSLRGPIDVIAHALEQAGTRQNDRSVLRVLRDRGIVVLPGGELEQHYPRKYQPRDGTKTLNALHAATLMTEQEYRGARMTPIRELIEGL